MRKRKQVKALIDGCRYTCYLKGKDYFCEKQDNGCLGDAAATIDAMNFSTYCKSPTFSGVRECVRQERNENGRLVCREYTKDYRMVSPKDVICVMPDEKRPPAAVPTVEIATTALSEDENQIWQILGEKGQTVEQIAQRTRMPVDRTEYALIMLELKGLAVQQAKGIYQLRGKKKIYPDQIGLIHDYSHPSGGKDFKASYQILEADELMPSHDPLKNFRWTPGYPEGIQDRDYSKVNLPYQAKVMEKASTLDPSRVISTAKTSVEGPPIVVGEENIVLSGNSRALSIILASAKYPQKFKNYVDYLTQNAVTFGLSPQAIKELNKPVLIRRVAIPISEYKLFASLANESPAMTLDIIGTMQSVAKYIPDDIVMTMDIGDEETLRAYIASSRGQRFAKAIINALPATKVGAYVDRGMLTEEGKALIEGVLLFKLIPNMETLEQTPKPLKNTIAFNIPEFFRIKIGTIAGQMPPEWDLSSALPKAVNFYNRNLTETPLSFWLRQESLFEEEKDVFEEDTLQGQLVVLLDKFGNSPRKFRDIIRAYANQAEQILIPPPGGPVGVLQELIGGISKSGKMSGYILLLGGFGMDIFDVIKEGKTSPRARAPKRRRRRR